MKKIVKIWDYLKQPSNSIPVLLVIVVAFIPLVLRLHVEDKSIYSTAYREFLYTNFRFDIFHYYKGVVLILVSFLLLLSIIVKKKLKLQRWNILLVIICFFVLFSSILSPYKGYTIMGGSKSFQGVFVWLSYLFLIFAASQVKELKHFKLIAYTAIVTGVILGVFGIFQLIGFDLRFYLEGLIYHSGYKMKVSNKFIGLTNSLSFNTNYYGVFMLLLTILSSTLFFYFQKRKWEVISLVAYLFIFSNLVGSYSRASNYTYFVCVLIIFFLLRNKGKQFFKKAGVYVVLSVLVFFIVSSFLNRTNKLINPNVMGAKFSGTSLKDIKVTDSLMAIFPYENKPLYIGVSKRGGLNFAADKSFKNVLKVTKGDTLTFKNTAYKHYKFYFSKTNYYNPINLVYDNAFTIPIVVDKGGFYVYVKGKLRPFINPEKWEYFHKNNRIVSSRGMIWALSGPILKKTMVLGYGADAFPLAYPNEDYVSRIKTYGNITNSYVAASHSLYFQIGIEFGVIALLLFIVLVGWYLLSSIKTLVKSSFDHWMHYFNMACFLMVLSFMITGLTNSSVLSSSTNFWVFLGLGFAVNNYLREKSIS